MIIFLRVMTQFYINPELYLLFLSALFITSLITLIELLKFPKDNDYFDDFRFLIGGLILGIGIHLIFVNFLISSTMSTEIIKIPLVFTFLAFLVLSNQTLFNPKDAPDEKPDNRGILNEIGSLKLFLLGMLFYLSITWVFNPVAIAMYDVVILNGFSFGFLYYSIILSISLVAGYIMVNYIFTRSDITSHKRWLIIFNSVYGALNCLGFFFLDSDYSMLSTVYLTLLTVLGALTIIFDVSYLFYYYTLPSGIKSFLGFMAFLIGFILSFVIFLYLSWAVYLSMLLSNLIISALFFGLFILIELIKIRTFNWKRKPLLAINKPIGVLYIIILGISIIPLISIPLTRTYSNPSEGNPTVMVWNIHNAGGLDNKFDLDRIIDEIRRYNPDILGLNEVDVGAIKTGFIDIGAYIANKLNMYYYYGPTFIKHYGNAILSKYPFQFAEYTRLPRVEENGKEPRAVIKAKFSINSEIWTVYVNHLATNKDDRLLQVPFIVNKINEESFQRVIWMGDFNFRPNSEEYSKINGTSALNFTDTHEFINPPAGLTGGLDKNAVPSNRIDYILSSPDLIPIEKNIHCSLASDHCAVITKF
jgi:endonuclease/exonuclease/phosphatase family metal-dependent hydrolase